MKGRTMRPTAEQIARHTDSSYGLANKRAINKEYRRLENQKDLDRAIRRVRKHERAYGAIYGLEYCYALEEELSRLHNQF